jgi:hypothetical protein
MAIASPAQAIVIAAQTKAWLQPEVIWTLPLETVAP